MDLKKIIQNMFSDQRRIKLGINNRAQFWKLPNIWISITKKFQGKS